MAAIEYPAGLPCPQTLRNVSAERRLLSDQPARQARTFQRDRAYVESLTFPPLSGAQAAAFQAWWRDDLMEGGAWFAASWPLPQGVVAGVRRFLGVPQWEFIPGGMWRVSATCELRGRGELPHTAGAAPPPPPAALFLDTFTGSAGTLITAHTPDIAPIGFAYADAGSGPNTVLQLGGSGRAITVPVGYGTAGVADASASSPAFALELTFPYTVTFIGRPSDTLAWSFTGVLLSNSADGSYLEITLNRDAGPQYWIGVEMVNNAVGGGYLWQDNGITGVAAEHTVSVYVEQTQCTVSFDGVAGPPVDLEGVAAARFDGLRFGLDFDYPADNAYIDRFEVA